MKLNIEDYIEALKRVSADALENYDKELPFEEKKLVEKTVEDYIQLEKEIQSTTHNIIKYNKLIEEQKIVIATLDTMSNIKYIEKYKTALILIRNVLIVSAKLAVSGFLNTYIADGNIKYTTNLLEIFKGLEGYESI